MTALSRLDWRAYFLRVMTSQPSVMDGCDAAHVAVLSAMTMYPRELDEIERGVWVARKEFMDTYMRRRRFVQISFQSEMPKVLATHVRPQTGDRRASGMA